MKMLKTVLALVLVGFSVAAAAQWQWIDKDGRRVFSDRAPPSDIPDKNIITRSAVRIPANAAAAPADAGDAAPAPTPPKPSGVDKDLEARKKQVAEAEAAKKKAEDERNAHAKQENCSRARQAKTSLDSGVRIGRVNAAGEREFMDDAAREAEGRRLAAIIAADCAQ
ncbi:MAG: DUF4124 domain-containing protein [Burkholderiales bacterium]|nr:DUF4124 domain-containing protein [Burkholderiales bacterium]